MYLYAPEEVMSKHDRLVVAHICIDTEGNYSVDCPGADQGGTMGYGTVWYGDRGIETTLRCLLGTLRYFHGQLLQEVRHRTSQP